MTSHRAVFNFEFLLGLFLLAVPVIADAHPETGLSDAVAETEYRIALEIYPKDLATRNKLGMVLYRKNKLKEAEKAFMEVLKVSPASFDAHDGMGLIRVKEKKYEEAVTWFKKAIAVSNEETTVHYSLGFALEQMGRLKDAEAAYKRGLEVNGNLLGKGVNKEHEIEKKNMIQGALKQLQNKMKAGK